MIVNIFAASAVANRTLLVSEMNREAKEIETLLELTLQELSQVKIGS